MKHITLLTLCVALSFAAKSQAPCADTIRHTSLPYIEDFSGQTDSTLFIAGCWNRLLSPLDTTEPASTFAHVHCDDSTGCYLQMSHKSTAMPITVALPPVDDFSELELTLKHYSFHEGDSLADPLYDHGIISIGILENPDDPNSFQILSSFQTFKSWHRCTVRLGRYLGSGRSIAIRGIKSFYNPAVPEIDSNLFWHLLIDSIDLHPITTCGNVEHLIVSDITASEATFTWFDPENNGSYKVSIYGNGLDTTIITPNTYLTFTGLNPLSLYLVFVQPLCPVGEGQVSQTHFVTLDSTSTGDSTTTGTTTITHASGLVNVSRTQRVLIPDGPHCSETGYLEDIIAITEFEEGDTIRSGDDVRSVCVNLEHSFSGDVDMAVICPTGQMAILKPGAQGNFIHNYETDIIGRDGSIYLGFPLDSQPWDDANTCDSLYNPFGVGLEYCFSRSQGYTLVTGDDAGEVWSSETPLPSGDFYLSSTNTHIVLPVSYDTIPNYFLNNGGVRPSNTTLNVKHPSNHAQRSDYYLPVDPFDALTGCPMNGLWKLYIRDGWGIDNGWLFGWSIDLRGPDTTNNPDTTHLSIEENLSSKTNVYAEHGQIVVDGTGSLPSVSVYDMTGREIVAPTQPTPGMGGKRMVFSVPSSGVYMVKVGDTPARKVVVLH